MFEISALCKQLSLLQEHGLDSSSLSERCQAHQTFKAFGDGAATCESSTDTVGVLQALSIWSMLEVFHPVALPAPVPAAVHPNAANGGRTSIHDIETAQQVYASQGYDNESLSSAVTLTPEKTKLYWNLEKWETHEVPLVETTAQPKLVLLRAYLDCARSAV